MAVLCAFVICVRTDAKQKSDLSVESLTTNWSLTEEKHKQRNNKIECCRSESRIQRTRCITCMFTCAHTFASVVLVLLLSRFCWCVCLPTLWCDRWLCRCLCSSFHWTCFGANECVYRERDMSQGVEAQHNQKTTAIASSTMTMTIIATPCVSIIIHAVR